MMHMCHGDAPPLLSQNKEWSLFSGSLMSRAAPKTDDAGDDDGGHKAWKLHGDNFAPLLGARNPITTGALIGVRSYRHNPYSFESVAVSVEGDATLGNDGDDNALDKWYPYSSSDYFANTLWRADTTMTKSVALAPFSQASTRPTLDPQKRKKRPHLTKDKKNATSMCCYFEQSGTCKKGDKCWYGHTGGLYTPCHYGLECKAGHATLVLMAAMANSVKVGDNAHPTCHYDSASLVPKPTATTSCPLLTSPLSVKPDSRTLSTLSPTIEAPLRNFAPVDDDVPCEHC